MKAAAAKYSHRAVRPLLVADKVVGGKHHLADVTVKAGFMPVLREGKKNNLKVISHTSGQQGKEGIHTDGLFFMMWSFSLSYKNNIRSTAVLSLSSLGN